jgi:hypothetical protein
MTEQPKFEVGKYYRTRSKRKALCVHVWEDGGALFIDTDPDVAWSVKANGKCTNVETPYDIIGEWRPPRTWTVYVIEYADGSVGVSLQDVCSTRGSRRARVTVTEGQGLEPGRSDFEKDMM